MYTSSKLLNKYNKVIIFIIEKPKELVYSRLIRQSKVEIINDNQIKIIIKPSLLDPFAGKGNINLYLSTINHNNKCEVKCEIVPTVITLRSLYILLSLLLIWTIMGIAISTNWYSLLIIASGYTALVLVFHLTSILNRGILESQMIHLMSTIKSK
jgi:hypothetical protein